MRCRARVRCASVARGTGPCTSACRRRRVTGTARADRRRRRTSPPRRVTAAAAHAVSSRARGVQTLHFHAPWQAHSGWGGGARHRAEAEQGADGGRRDRRLPAPLAWGAAGRRPGPADGGPPTPKVGRASSRATACSRAANHGVAWDRTPNRATACPRRMRAGRCALSQRLPGRCCTQPDKNVRKFNARQKSRNSGYPEEGWWWWGRRGRLTRRCYAAGGHCFTISLCLSQDC